jgi:hypothetical protein
MSRSVLPSFVTFVLLAVASGCQSSPDAATHYLQGENFANIRLHPADSTGTRRYEALRDGQYCSGRVWTDPSTTHTFACDDTPTECDPEAPLTCAARAIALRSTEPANANQDLTRACMHGADVCAGWPAGTLTRDDYTELRTTYAVGCGRGVVRACVRHGEAEALAGRVDYGRRMLAGGCKVGVADACLSLGALYATDGDDHTDPEPAWKRACSLGSDSACRRVGSDAS